ncbi:MAG: carboxypeptidase-like regulatory domain-containing protein [Bacteroidales bacterium]|nr:carboxypeptidase-like regulatory domain-containing protein [Bacteroidales bacterium]
MYTIFKVIIFSIFTILSAYGVNGQTIPSENKIFGKVTDIKGEPLVGATISIEKSNRGTETDIEGNYSIKVSTIDTLVFNFVGMKTQKIKADKKEINVQMHQGVALKEVFGPPYQHSQIEKIDPTKTVGTKDIKNADNPKYNFNKNAKNSEYIIYVAELNSYDFNEEDLQFQEKFRIKYMPTLNPNIDIQRNTTNEHSNI